MTAAPDFDQHACIHCGQVGVTAETVACPETRTVYKGDQGFGDWPGPHIMRRQDDPAPPRRAEDTPPAA